jgi:hypothetical protein
VTQRRALGDLDYDSAFDDPENGWFGHVQAADPTSLHGHEDQPEPPPGELVRESVDTDRRRALTLDTPPDVDETHVAYVLDPGPAAEPTARRWSDEPPPVANPTWESRLSGNGAWDFKVAATGPRRFHPRLAVAGMAAAGLVVAGIVVFVRSPGPADDESPVVAPSQSTSSVAPSTSMLSPAPVPPGPPGPPPPPPPTAEEISPPVVSRDYTPRRQNAPDDPGKPEIGVTRTPVTRTQMSAAPPPPRSTPDRNSATPGDSERHRGRFGF